MRSERTTALRFIVLMGIVSLFGDITYEGSRSISGPYLAMLGAGAATVGMVAGLGEFMGYALRLLSGYLADRTRAYWTLTFAGYGLMLSIPMLAFAGHWQTAAFFIVLERMGKAVRTPARDAILSHATKHVGRGFGFGLHEALDQVGAVLGPLIFTFSILLKGSYREGFAVLWIPGLLALAFLLKARQEVPEPEKLEDVSAASKDGKDGLPRIFWIYALFAFFSVAGFAHFQLIAYHFKFRSVVSDVQIPLFYIIAMAVDGVVALLIGKVYDKKGLASLIAIPLLTLPLPFFAFSQSYAFAVISVVLWGAVMGIHETVMRAAIADLAPIGRRGIAYGIFNTVYGGAFLFGSAAMGLLYETSINSLLALAVSLELVSLAILLFLIKAQKA